MKLDEHSQDEIQDQSTSDPQVFRGSNQSGLRDYNERLVLSMIQRSGAIPGVEIARRAGLSPQTVSVILRSLEADGLLERGTPQRGRVGKPSIPMGLNPEGLFSVGVKIGRRSADLVLTDFLGKTRQLLQTTYRYPMPEAILGFLKSGLTSFREALGDQAADRISGIGIAMPFEIWNWSETIGAPPNDIAAWRDLDFAAEIGQFTNLPVFIENDATAACRAEHVYGLGRTYRDFAYFFVGSFIGGCVVLNHAVFEGARGNAGAFGSLPVRLSTGEDKQLIDVASLYRLEADLARKGIEPARIWASPQDWHDFPEVLENWIDYTARHLARAALTVCAVIDFEAVVIDGAFPEDVRTRLIDRVRNNIVDLDQRGLFPPVIAEGTVGRNARAMGAACSPVFNQFLLNTLGGLSQSS